MVGFSVVSWVLSVIITGITFLCCALPSNEGGDFEWHTKTTRSAARWLLTSIFFGWMMPLILSWKAFKSLWLVAELPKPRLPTVFRSNVIDQDAGSLSFPKNK